MLHTGSLSSERRGNHCPLVQRDRWLLNLFIHLYRHPAFPRGPEPCYLALRL